MMDPVLVSEVMERCVHTIHCQQSVAEAEHILTRSRISGAPMVASDGQIMGVVSKTDITRFHRDSRHADPEAQMVYEIGTPIAVTIDEGATLREAAGLMAEREIHRLVVVRGGVPVGIITSLDVARLFAET